MAALSSKSSQEICDLLDEYGIKHGPVVDTTRSLYERKLREAMSKGRRATAPVPPPAPVPEPATPDRTYYREEEDEVTYIHRTPMRSETLVDSRPYRRSKPDWSEREYEHESSSYLRSRPERTERDYQYDTPHMRARAERTERDYQYDTPHMRARAEWSERDYQKDMSYMRAGPERTEREYHYESKMYDRPATYRSPYLQSMPIRPAAPPKAPKSSRLIPLWAQFLFFLAVAVFLYLVFSNMETDEYSNRIE